MSTPQYRYFKSASGAYFWRSIDGKAERFEERWEPIFSDQVAIDSLLADGTIYETDSTGAPLGTGKDSLTVDDIDWHARYEEADQCLMRIQHIMGDSDPCGGEGDEPRELLALGIIPGDEASERVGYLYNEWIRQGQQIAGMEIGAESCLAENRELKATVAAMAAALRFTSSELRNAVVSVTWKDDDPEWAEWSTRSEQALKESEAALSTDVGKGWMSPTDVEKMKQEFIEMTARGDQAYNDAVSELAKQGFSKGQPLADSIREHFAAIRERLTGLGRDSRHLLTTLDQLMDESEGVSGLHRNGDIAPWSDLRSGGHYSAWLGDAMDGVQIALDPAPAQTGRVEGGPQ